MTYADYYCSSCKVGLKRAPNTSDREIHCRRCGTIMLELVVKNYDPVEAVSNIWRLRAQVKGELNEWL